MFLVRAGTVVLSNSYFIILVLLLLVYLLQVNNDPDWERLREKEKETLEKPEEKQSCKPQTKVDPLKTWEYNIFLEISDLNPFNPKQLFLRIISRLTKSNIHRYGS